jgi:hypothetical protein
MIDENTLGSGHPFCKRWVASARRSRARSGLKLDCASTMFDENGRNRLQPVRSEPFHSVCLPKRTQHRRSHATVAACPAARQRAKFKVVADDFDASVKANASLILSVTPSLALKNLLARDRPVTQAP